MYNNIAMYNNSVVAQIEERNQQAINAGFTKLPNIYLDRIKKTLTQNEQSVFEHVIRQTVGWRRETAMISNSRFTQACQLSERSVIYARKSLIEKNLLVVIEPPRGRKAGIYQCNFLEPFKPFFIPPPQETIKEAIQEVKPPEKEMTQENDLLKEKDQIKTESLPEEKIVDNSVDKSVDNSKSEKRRVARKSVRHPSRYIKYTHRNNKKKHTAKNAKAKSENAEIEAQAKIVCSEFLKIFPNAVPTMALFCYAVKLLGLERALENLKIVRDYSTRHKVKNPCGLFRDCIDKNYEPPARLRLRMKADAGAEKAIQKASEEFQKELEYRQNFSWESSNKARLECMKNLPWAEN